MAGPLENVLGAHTDEVAWPDPLHEQSGPTTFWSTANANGVVLVLDTRTASASHG